MRRIFVSAGEASGDHYGAGLMAAMQKIDSGLEFFGLGGAEMRARGFRAVIEAESVAHMGITEVVLHAPGIWRKFQRLKRSLRHERPELAVLIDFPDVNFRLAKEAKRLGVPVLWLVSPQLWAWKKRRLRWVQERVTKMLVIYPFEKEFYGERGVEAEFIGHPLAELPAPAVSREEYASRYGLNANKPWIALLPGSRAKELKLNLPGILGAAKLLGESHEFLLPVAATLSQDAVARELAACDQNLAPKIHLVEDARAAMFHARGSIVASGTATVQAAVIGNPFVIVYRMSPVSHWIARRLVSVPFAGMPNLIAGKEIVRELLQDDFTPQNVAAALQPMLREGELRQRQMGGLRTVRAMLSPQLLSSGEGEELPKAAVAADNENTAAAMARAARAAFALLAK